MSAGDRAGCRKHVAWMDRAFEGTLGQRRWDELRRHLSTCTDCRERYNRLGYVSRVLAVGPVPAFALERIESAVLDAASADGRGPAGSRGLWVSAAASLALAVAVLLLVALPRDRVSDLRPRGIAPGIEHPFPGDRRPGVRLFCIQTARSDVRVVAETRAVEAAIQNRPLHCNIGSELQLAYTTPSFKGLTMIAYATDSSGNVAWYAPASADADSVTLTPDVIDEPVSWSTRLEVNHAPGSYDVLVRFFDRAILARSGADGDVEPLYELRARLEVTP